MNRPPVILCVASFFKGSRFIQECHRQGCRVFLLTRPDLAQQPWPREQLADVFHLPQAGSGEDLTRSVSLLARHHEIDRIVPLDDYDVEVTAAMREHLRIPGMSQTRARFFRDKLAMRVRAREVDLRCPRFEHVLNHGRLHRFMQDVPGPWILKPRSEAGAVGIRKIHDPEEFWRQAEVLGDRQSDHLLEEFVPGQVYHVDSLVWEGRVRFAAAHGYLRPPFEIWNHGGVFATRTVPPGTPLDDQLQEFNDRLVRAMGLDFGVTHAEFIRSEVDGQVYFLEIASRVGGAHIDDLVTLSTGVDLWQEWARMELASLGGEGYAVPPFRRDFGGLVICLARQQHPDLSGYQDPEVVWRMDREHHAGLILTSPDSSRVDWLTERYIERFYQDFLAVCPPTDKPPA